MTAVNGSVYLQSPGIAKSQQFVMYRNDLFIVLYLKAQMHLAADLSRCE